MALFKPAYLNTLNFERGWSDDPEDPGRATYNGITIHTLKLIAPRIGLNAPVTKDKLRGLPDAAVQRIYDMVYWLGMYDNINSQPVANYIFDMAVNHGAGDSHCMTQEVLNKLGCNLKVDGIFGRKTCDAVNASSGLLDGLRERRQEFYLKFLENHPGLEHDRHGLLRRAREA